ncbi:transmembrane protein [Ceratobasidium theobromae]|uniref:Transmembrane protein n=1 Tax=Ceratobasidium theobromae TaxID=1582974 RepID=A0A5N5QNI3_9AGAM|nr:transmembrane protein [Ceratobasidium theobromae]
MLFSRLAVAALSFGCAVKVFAAPIVVGLDSASLDNINPNARVSDVIPRDSTNDTTFVGAIDNANTVAQGLLDNISSGKSSDLVTGLTNLGSVLETVNSVLGAPDVNLDTLLVGVDGSPLSIDQVSTKLSSAISTVNQVLSGVKSLGPVSVVTNQLTGILGQLNQIESGLGVAPQLLGPVKALLAQTIGLVGGLLGSLGITL